MTGDLWFEQLADTTADLAHERAPARLRSRVYSAVVAQMADSAPLLDLRATRTAGGHLCVFEHALAVLPSSTRLGSTNPCRICHARVLGERMEHAPIFWPGCPYSQFHNG